MALATPSPASLRGAEVADDRGVGEQEERLGDEGEERRQREPEDLAVLAGRLLALPSAPGVCSRTPET